MHAAACRVLHLHVATAGVPRPHHRPALEPTFEPLSLPQPEARSGPVMMAVFLFQPVSAAWARHGKPNGWRWP
eukprot:1188656-Lingulodinium_polyedra.AAC.1